MKKGLYIAQWIFGIIFALFALVNGFHWSSLLILASALLIMPVPLVRNTLLKINIKGFKIKHWMVITLAVLLFYSGIITSPLEENSDVNDENSSFSENYDSGNGQDGSEGSNVEGDSNSTKNESFHDENSKNNLDDNFSDTPTTPIPNDTPIIKPSVGNEIAVPVNPLELPAYSGNPYVIIENNVPSFSSEELTVVGYEKYSSLDSLGRCGVAIASCGKEIMPREDEKRGSISSIKPSGWIQASYSGISGGYLWNRCHLIGWQLSAENANRKNLITGTRYMNVSGMLPFENMIADYIKETDNHVAFRVTPIFEGSNLVCSGVQMEAYSVEDNGEGICFNVYCYNVQPGIVIDYATGDSSKPTDKNVNETVPKKEQTNDQQTNNSESENGNEIYNKMVWIPKSGKKYHSNPNCSNMKNPEKVTVEEAEGRNYSPCSKCY